MDIKDIIEHKDIKGYYYLRYYDNTLSTYGYNLTRARAFLKFGEEEIDYTGFDSDGDRPNTKRLANRTARTTRSRKGSRQTS